MTKYHLIPLLTSTHSCGTIKLIRKSLTHKVGYIPLSQSNMQMSLVVHEQRRRKRLYDYCSNLPRRVSTFSEPAEGKATSSNTSMVSHIQLLALQSFTQNAQIKHGKNVFVHPVLIDSRAAANFIDHDMATQLKFPMQTLQNPLKINATSSHQDQHHHSLH